MAEASASLVGRGSIRNARGSSFQVDQAPKVELVNNLAGREQSAEMKVRPPPLLISGLLTVPQGFEAIQEIREPQ